MLRPVWAPSLKALLVIVIVPSILFTLGGCSSMSKAELGWQALHAVDIAQTLNGPSQDPCYEEVDPLTRSLIGAQPHRDAVLAWGVGFALAHAGVTWGLEHANAPRWVKIGWQAVTWVNTGQALVNNHRAGIRPFGDNRDACP